MRLHLLLTLIVNGIILVAFGGYGAYSAWERSVEREADIQRDTRAVAQSIAAGAANDLLEGNFDNLEGLLLRNAVIGSLTELAIADAEGSIIAQVKRGNNGVPQVVYAATRKPIHRVWLEQQAGDDYGYLLAIERGERIGWIGVAASLDELEHIRWHIWIATLTSALWTGLFSSLVLILVIRQISRRLEEAASFSTRLIDQHGGAITAHCRVTELNELQIALNQASQVLHQQFSELRNSEARKSAILEASMDCLISIDAEGRIVGLNPAAISTFGYTRDEAIGAVMADLMVPPADRAAHTQGMQQFRATGHGPILHRRVEVTAMRRDGSEFPVELTVVPFDLDGQPHFLGSLRDIGERKTLEAAQQRTRALLQQTVADLAAKQFALDQHAIVSISDLDGKIIYANDKLSEVSQYRPDELLGQNHRLLKSGLHDANFYAEMWATIASGTVWHGEIANRRKNGDIYWVASTIVPMLDLDGRPHQYIAIRTDITQQKQTEQELGLNQRTLETLVGQYRETQEQLGLARAKELAIGSQIQHSLLFGEVPAEHGGLSIAVHTEASQGIDGDFYDFFSYGPAQFDLSIGDVMGKGVAAALLGAALKQQLNRCIAANLAHATQGRLPEPEALINAVHAQITPRLIELETFVTLSYLRFDLERRRLTFVDAGHTHSILVGDRGARLLAGDNLPLGVIATEIYQQSTTGLVPGDLIFLYSDGVTEARAPDGEEFGVERLIRFVSELHAQKIPPRMLVQAVRVRLHEFEQRAVPSDDRTCIAIQLNPLAAAGVSLRNFELPWALEQLTPLRREIETAAHAAAFDETATAALVLAAFEAVTNVIRHTPQPLADATLHCRLESGADGLAVILHYLGAAFEPSATQPDFSGESDGGFGLYIIRNSVDAVIYDSPITGVCRIRLDKHRAAATPPQAT